MQPVSVVAACPERRITAPGPRLRRDLIRYTIPIPEAVGNRVMSPALRECDARYTRGFGVRSCIVTFLAAVERGAHDRRCLTPARGESPAEMPRHVPESTSVMRVTPVASGSDLAS